LRGKQVQILLRHLELTVGRDDVGILRILVVQGRQLPSRRLLLLGVIELGHLSEHGHLLDQALQGSRVNREGRVRTVILQTGALLLLQLVQPDGYHLLELRAGKVAEGGVLAKVGVVLILLQLLFQSVAQGLAQVGKLGWLRKRAQGRHDLSPVLEVGIVDHVPEILAHDRGQ
jgi:hypothetical protein